MVGKMQLEEIFPGQLSYTWEAPPAETNQGVEALWLMTGKHVKSPDVHEVESAMLSRQISIYCTSYVDIHPIFFKY